MPRAKFSATPKAANNVFNLKMAKENISRDTIEALEYLLQEAKSGELIGLVYGGILKGQTALADAVGEARRNPIFALGVAGFLSHSIAERMKLQDE